MSLQKQLHESIWPSSRMVGVYSMLDGFQTVGLWRQRVRQTKTIDHAMFRAVGDGHDGGCNRWSLRHETTPIISICNALAVAIVSIKTSLMSSNSSIAQRAGIHQFADDRASCVMECNHSHDEFRNRLAMPQIPSAILPAFPVSLLQDPSFPNHRSSSQKASTVRLVWFGRFSNLPSSTLHVF